MKLIDNKSIRLIDLLESKIDPTKESIKKRDSTQFSSLD